MPGVVAASAARSTSGATGTLPGVHLEDLAGRPSASGGLTATRRSKRPGRSSAGSSTSGRLVAASTTTPSLPVKPSISVRIWLSVCSRSSTPPMLPPPRARPIASSSSMKMIAGAAFFAVSKRSRTREAPTPTMNSMNSDADRWKNGTCASPATARASSVLPVPGCAGQQHALGDGRAEPPVLVRVAEEVDHLGELLLHLVDAGDVVERGPRPGLRLVPLGPRPADPADAAEPAAGRHPPEEPDQQPDEQQRRAEAEQQLLPAPALESGGRALTVTSSSSSRLVRPSSPKAGRWVVKSVTSLASPSFGGYFAAACERALDGVAGRGDLADVAGLHLLPEERVRHRGPARRHQRRGDDPVDDEEQQDEPPGAAGGPAPVRLGRVAVGGRRRGALHLPRRPVGRPGRRRRQERAGVSGRGGASVARPAIAC